MLGLVASKLSASGNSVTELGLVCTDVPNGSSNTFIVWFSIIYLGCVLVPLYVWIRVNHNRIALAVSHIFQPVDYVINTVSDILKGTTAQEVAQLIAVNLLTCISEGLL